MENIYLLMLVALIGLAIAVLNKLLHSLEPINLRVYTRVNHAISR